ncbi:hypothetical protein CKA32_003878 [Geitlerinema sp. FC II]|nr:hypothetical protein CKA32_003878 [Geitlerinema sp. FC II]
MANSIAIGRTHGIYDDLADRFVRSFFNNYNSRGRKAIAVSRIALQ